MVKLSAVMSYLSNLWKKWQSNTTNMNITNLNDQAFAFMLKSILPINIIIYNNIVVTVGLTVKQ